MAPVNLARPHGFAFGSQHRQLPMPEISHFLNIVVKVGYHRALRWYLRWSWHSIGLPKGLLLLVLPFYQGNLPRNIGSCSGFRVFFFLQQLPFAKLESPAYFTIHPKLVGERRWMHAFRKSLSAQSKLRGTGFELASPSSFFLHYTIYATKRLWVSDIPNKKFLKCQTQRKLLYRW